jgi:hypothetical protein
VRIDPRLVPSAVTSASRRPGAGGASFEPAGKDTSKAAGPRAAAPLATLDAILALQTEEDPAERRRRSAQRGRDLLDALDGLKAGLLSGAVSAGKLGQVARILAGAGSSGDPGLDAIIGEIELRAKVELAKLGRTDLA